MQSHHVTWSLEKLSIFREKQDQAFTDLRQTTLDAILAGKLQLKYF